MLHPIVEILAANGPLRTDLEDWKPSGWSHRVNGRLSNVELMAVRNAIFSEA